MSQARPPSDPRRLDVIRWSVGCLVSAAATLGVVILVFLVSIALQPPVWVQVMLGVALAIGGAILAWLVASALAQAKSSDRPPGVRPLRSDDARDRS